MKQAIDAGELWCWPRKVAAWACAAWGLRLPPILVLSATGKRLVRLEDVAGNGRQIA